MWNKLFKSKSKSSKNLSNRSCSGSGFSVADPAGESSNGQHGGPSSSVAQFEQYGSNVGVAPEPVRLRSRSAVRDPDNLDLTSSANSHRDSIGVQMCGIPMRRSKLSSAFKSLSLKRSASKSRLKLAAPGPPAPDGERPAATLLLADEYDVLVAGKRASLRPCKSAFRISVVCFGNVDALVGTKLLRIRLCSMGDSERQFNIRPTYCIARSSSTRHNNLSEKQQYTEAEKEEPVYIEQCKPYDPFDVSSEPPPNLELQACHICSRKFAPASLTKHIGICERVQAKKRKPFDSSRQRREGTELASYLPKNFGLPQKTVSSSNEAIPVRKLSLSKTPTFERKEFNPTTAMSTSMPSASTPKTALKRSMSQQNEPCPYCERCFGIKAYDRHVEWCREKALLTKNAGNNQSISAAKERLQARIQYKAPQIRSKRALNREKYSGSLSCGGSTNSLAELDLHMPRHNSMSSSVSSDKKPHPSTSLQQLSLSIGTNVAKEPKANTKREETRKVTKRTKTFTLSSDRLQNDANNNHKSSNNPSNANPNGNSNNNSSCHSYHHQPAAGNRNEPGCRTQARTLLNRSTIDNATAVHRPDKSRPAEQQLKVEKFEIIGHNHTERLTNRPVLAQTVRCTMSNSGYSPDRYDPFLSARRQLEELFSPATSLIHASSPVSTSTSTSRLNQMASSAATNEGSKSTGDSANRTSPHNSNFRRAYSLRMPRKVSRPMYVEKAKSNIQKGITDDGPVSPNFLKSSEYDELPIKSTFNALQMAEPKPKLRDSSTVRKNLKLDIKDPAHPGTAGDLPLSKTDSLAVFLKYETELALSEKDMKDKSNSLSKRTSSLSAEASLQRKQEPVSVVQLPMKKPETPTAHEQEPTSDRGSLPSVEEPTLAKKQPQKLVPIKLEPINITYNGSGATDSSVPPKPVVISLDAIIGKTNCAKPKDSQFDKENRSDNHYIDPKLINKCDNLPVKGVKAATMDIEGSGSSRTSSSSGTLSTTGNGGLVEGRQLLMKAVEPEVDRNVPPPPPPRKSIKVFQKPPEQTNTEKSSSELSIGDSGSSNGSSPTESNSTSPVDNRTTEDSTKSDKRPQLTHQDREDSGYRTGQDSLPETGPARESQEYTSKSSTLPVPIATADHAHKTPSTSVANNNVNHSILSPPSTPNSQPNVGTIRTSSSAGTSASLGSNGGQRPRPSIVSALEDFDVDEFMQSLEDLHRRSPASAKDFKPSLFGRTQSSVTGRSVSAGQTTVASSKRSNSLDSSNSNTIVSTSHFERTEASSGVPRVDVRVRNGSGTASSHNSSNSSSSISSPSHYSKCFTSNPYYSNSIHNNKSPHNHSASNGSKGGGETAVRTSDSAVHPLAQRMNNTRKSPLVARRPASDESSVFSLPSVSPASSSVGIGSTSTVQNLPNIHQTVADPWRNGNGHTGQQQHHHQAGNVHVSARSYFSSPSPVNGRNSSYNSQTHHASHTGTPSSTTPTSSHWPSGAFHDPRFPTESFDHLERDLLKSVQELDRMCGSSSSVCSIDSEELYSVDDYPLHKRSSERSQASADSAYRSLSTQSPPDYAPPVPLRQGHRPSSRISTPIQNQQASMAEPPDSTFNALPSHTSLPPLTSAVALKGHPVEMHPHKDGMDCSGPNLIMNPMSKFCHECGARFMVSSAKFCMSCGVRRIVME